MLLFEVFTKKNFHKLHVPVCEHYSTQLLNHSLYMYTIATFVCNSEVLYVGILVHYMY